MALKKTLYIEITVMPLHFHSLDINFFALCSVNDVFRQFLIYNSACIVYRLIDTALIGNVFYDPFLF